MPSKWIPGQVSFNDPSSAYWPQPGLIEHGSYVTGQSDIWQYGRDPYRGVYGLGCPPGMERIATTRCGPMSQTKCVSRSGMGNLLTDYACSQSQFAQDWRNRFGEVMGTTRYSAIGAAAAAGLIGALMKKPLLGLVAGGVIGWMLHESQTATYAEFMPR